MKPVLGDDGLPRLQEVPGVVTFDPVCGNHKSDRTKDWITEELFHDFNAKAEERGLTPDWQGLSITFYPWAKKTVFEGRTLHVPDLLKED
jgi:hypothetical protein